MCEYIYIDYYSISTYMDNACTSYYAHIVTHYISVNPLMTIRVKLNLCFLSSSIPLIFFPIHHTFINILLIHYFFLERGLLDPNI